MVNANFFLINIPPTIIYLDSYMFLLYALIIHRNMSKTAFEVEKTDFFVYFA